MAVRFRVIKSNRGDKPWVDCDSEEKSDHLREPSDHAPHEILYQIRIVAEPSKNHPSHVHWEIVPVIEAIAKLDDANFGSRDPFHRAMAEIFEMGMEAQRELTKMAQEKANQDIANGNR